MDEIEIGVELNGDGPVALNMPGVAAHTAVFAQTGAGKSFLVGRYLEEILLKTRAKVVILDPNSDFLKFGQPSTARDEGFAPKWKSIPVDILSNRDPASVSPDGHECIRRVVIDWSGLSPLEQCRYLGFSGALDYQEFITVALANRVAGADKAHYTLHDFLATLRQMRDHVRFNGERDTPSTAPMPDIDWNLLPEQSLLKVYTEAFKLSELEIWPEAAGTPSVDDVIREFGAIDSDRRLLILDLPSLDQQLAQSMLADRVIELLWRSARDNWMEAVKDSNSDDPRVPIFIVIDEAHNLVPAETMGDVEGSVKARLTRIAAEGRKYGLFLVLVTQRPSRISYDVLSQVENLFLMKLTNRIDLGFIEQTFGSLDPAVIRQAERLSLGQLILSGRLVAEPVMLRGLPRRTQEGGRNLQASTWIRPPVPA